MHDLAGSGIDHRDLRSGPERDDEVRTAGRHRRAEPDRRQLDPTDALDELRIDDGDPRRTLVGRVGEPSSGLEADAVDLLRHLHDATERTRRDIDHADAPRADIRRHEATSVRADCERVRLRLTGRQSRDDSKGSLVDHGDRFVELRGDDHAIRREQARLVRSAREAQPDLADTLERQEIDDVDPPTVASRRPDRRIAVHGQEGTSSVVGRDDLMRSEARCRDHPSRHGRLEVDDLERAVVLAHDEQSTVIHGASGLQ
jgi:hypothetical protein